MKKILILLILCVSFLGFSTTSFAECKFDKTEGAKVSDMLKANCINDTALVEANDVSIEGGFKEKINGWTNNIALFLGILAVGSVIYGGLMMTLSAGEDERIKKAKDIVKWGLAGFLGVVMATTIVTLVINLMYGFAG